MHGTTKTLTSIKKGRSRVTNGRVPRGVDGRGLWFRRHRDIVSLHIADLGGPDAVTESQKAIVQRAATIIVALEQLEIKFANANEATALELEQFTRASNSLRRHLETLGLDRKPKDITPSLKDYLAGKANGHQRTRIKEIDG